MNQKSLHVHALPVLILAIGLLLLSGLLMIRATSPSISDRSLSRLLNVRLFNIKPASNGLFHITRYGSDNQANLSALSQTGSLGMMEDVGRVAQIDAVVNGTKN